MLAVCRDASSAEPSFDIGPFRHLYPFASHVLDRGGLRYHYVDEGCGELVVMVHGNPTWSFFYRDLIGALCTGYRVVAPDHIGCGLSDKPGDGRYVYRLASRVDDLGALLDHLGIERNVTLVLHDWGGAIGMAWAARHPERVARLVILNTAAFPLPSTKPLPWSLRIVRDFRAMGWIVQGLNAFARVAARVATVKRLPADVRRAYLAPYDSWDHRIATLRFVQDIPLGPGDPSWPLLLEMHRGLARFRDTPALVCWGERDFVFDEHFLRQWQLELPHAEIHRFPRAGHYVL
ncbi:MAG: alpha/beta fold hydrolase, partial [Candidatus Binatia bacterium]